MSAQVGIKFWHPYGAFLCLCCDREWAQRFPISLLRVEDWPTCCGEEASLTAPLLHSEEYEEPDYALWRCVPCMRDEAHKDDDTRAWLGPVIEGQVPLCRLCCRQAEILTPLSLFQ